MRGVPLPTLISSVKRQAYTECGVAAALGCWRLAANGIARLREERADAQPEQARVERLSEDTNVARRFRSRRATCIALRGAVAPFRPAKLAAHTPNAFRV